MQEIEKEILDDYELKASELDSIRDDIYFIIEATSLCGDEASDTHLKAWNYEAIQKHLPNLIDLLYYKVKEMQDNINKLYDAKRDTKEHTESRQA